MLWMSGDRGDGNSHSCGGRGLKIRDTASLSPVLWPPTANLLLLSLSFLLLSLFFSLPFPFSSLHHPCRTRLQSVHISSSFLAAQVLTSPTDSQETRYCWRWFVCLSVSHRIHVLTSVWLASPSFLRPFYNRCMRQDISPLLLRPGRVPKRIRPSPIPLVLFRVVLNHIPSVCLLFLSFTPSSIQVRLVALSGFTSSWSSKSETVPFASQLYLRTTSLRFVSTESQCSWLCGILRASCLRSPCLHSFAHLVHYCVPGVKKNMRCVTCVRGTSPFQGLSPHSSGMKSSSLITLFVFPFLLPAPTTTFILQVTCNSHCVQH